MIYLGPFENITFYREGVYSKMFSFFEDLILLKFLKHK